MVSLVIRRIGITIFLLLAVSFLTFVLVQLAPGTAFDQYRANPQISSDLIKQLEAKYGLNDPIHIQYGKWLWNLLQGDMGYSFIHERPVTDLILEAFGNTVFLMAASIVVTWLLALPMGIYCAVNQYSWGDQFFSVLAFVGMSIPNFFLCFLLLYLASLIGGWPLGGMTSIGYQQMGFWERGLDLVQHMAIPVIVISTSAMAGLQRITRGNMLEVLRKQYVIAARARGLPESRVIYVHALRNAVNPLITIFGYQFSSLISGAALVEIIISWPGMGQLMLEAVFSQDQFLVVGGVLAGGVLLIFGNLIADILLGWVDPRIQMGSSGVEA